MMSIDPTVISQFGIPRLLCLPNLGRKTIEEIKDWLAAQGLSFRGGDVVEVLERVGREIGLPAAIRVDQGTEFVSRDLDRAPHGQSAKSRRLRC
jgi:hypothetical protein